MPDPLTTIGRCRFGPDSETLCLADATHHGLHAHAGCRRISFAVCDQHKPIIEPMCTHMHPFDSPCELPGSEFLPAENRCVMPMLTPPTERAAEEATPA